MASSKASSQKGASRIAVVVSRYNGTITGKLCRGAVEAAVERTGVVPDVFDVPGAFELPVVCDDVAMSGRFDGIVALGCLIRGETIHDRVIADSVANAIQHSMLKTGVPIAFGLLTVENVAQAQARAGGRQGNKGSEAVEALFDTIAVLNDVRAGRTGRINRELPDKSKKQARSGRRKG